MKIAELPGMQIASPLVHPKAVNFRPPSWPPSDNFPVICDNEGQVVSRYGDCRWDLSPLAGRTLSIHFGDGEGKGAKLSAKNASLLRQIVAWWLWGPLGSKLIRTVVTKFEAIKPLFVICSGVDVVASELRRFPKVIEQVAFHYNSRGNRTIAVLNELWLAQEMLGFIILDESGIKLMSSLLTETETTQTAYIPPRIWTYQVLRLRECLDDYLTHREQIEACFHFCIEAYATNAGGSLSKAFGGLGFDNPFRIYRNPGQRASGKIFYGSFQNTAERFGVDQLLERWVKTGSTSGIAAISSYLSLISYVGLAYVLNFSLMRIEEGSRLRANCYTFERVPFGDDIHLLQGITSKTIEDDDARWIVSPSVKTAIDAMSSVAFLRLEAAKHNSDIILSSEDIKNPLLQAFPHEPWSSRAQSPKRKQRLKKLRNYADILNIWPKLLDEKQMRINNADLEMANRMTFGLDPDRFAHGKTWPIAWHQLRRTGAVNMLASGLVTEASLQYQLKHATRTMSQYYGKNYYRLKQSLNDEARGFYLREMYQSMVREFNLLQTGRFISPHGEKRKIQILSEITDKDHKTLLKAAKSGRVTYRQTFLGGCANSGPPCPLGGISNISGCMGHGNESPCKSVFLDREKLPVIKQLRDVFIRQLKDAEVGSALQESLQAQLESAERALNVLETI